MFTKIEEIKSVRLKKTELANKEAMLSSPLLTDLALINHLYIWFIKACTKRNCPTRLGSVTQRKKFLFIILYLYSPATLAGGKMTVGLRDKLADVLDLHSRTAISDNCADIVFLYNRYKDFKEDVAIIYSQLLQQLETNGLYIDPAA